MQTLMQDLRYGFRTLLKTPAFTAVAVLTLALGIGANTAMFSLVNAVILRPLAYHDPDRLFVVHELLPKLSHLYPTIPVNARHFLAWRKEAKSFEQMAAVRGTSFNVTGDGEPERVGAARVSANLFSLLGARLQLGRNFLDEEDKLGRDRVAIISDSLWRRRFRADPGIVGRAITLDGAPFVVAGVMPPGFRFPRGLQVHSLVALASRTDIFKPIGFTSQELESFGEFDFGVLARLRAGSTAGQALAELNVLQAALAKDAPEPMELRAQIFRLHQRIVGDSRKGLLLLMGVVGFVLLIVCVNVANLSLVRAAGRRTELAIRAALGAGRARLLRQVLTESVVLALAGGALGVAAAYWIVDLLVSHAPVEVPRLEEISVDGAVLLFALAMSLLAGLLFGVWPALRAARSDPQEALQTGGRGGSHNLAIGRLRSLLVGAEVGLSAVLLIGAGLLLRSFVRLMGVERGFEAHSVMTLALGLPEARYREPAARTAFLQRTLEQIQSLPGVLRAGVATGLPLAPEGNVSIVTVEGAPRVPLVERPIANFRRVSPAYFAAIGIPLRAGRVFDYGDGEERLVVISEKMASRLWPGQDPIGRQIRRGDYDAPLLRVIGVVGDIRSESLAKEPVLMGYLPYWQYAPLDISLVIQTAMDPGAIAAAVRREIWRVDAQIPVPEMKTMERVVADSLAQRRYQMLLVLLFASTALLLACLGLYGVVSYTVEQRRHEIGVRVALGAGEWEIRRWILAEGLTPVAAGLAAGLVAALLLARLLGGLLYEVSAADPLTFAAVPALLAAVALAACYLPARRAARVDPMVALRYE